MVFDEADRGIRSAEIRRRMEKEPYAVAHSDALAVTARSC